VTETERKNAINTLVDHIDACTRALHDRDDAALAKALEELVSAATRVRARVCEARKKEAS